MKSVKFSLFLCGIAALLALAAAPPPKAPVAPTNVAVVDPDPVLAKAQGETRIPVTYWATEQEFDAYAFLVQLSRDQATNPAGFIVETSVYSPTNGFQVFLQPIFTQWVQGKAAHEHNRELADLNQSLTQLNATELRMIKTMMQTMIGTNTVPPPPPGK